MCDFIKKFVFSFFKKILFLFMDSYVSEHGNILVSAVSMKARRGRQIT